MDLRLFGKHHQYLHGFAPVHMVDLSSCLTVQKTCQRGKIASENYGMRNTKILLGQVAVPAMMCCYLRNQGCNSQRFFSSFFLHQNLNYAVIRVLICEAIREGCNQRVQ